VGDRELRQEIQEVVRTGGAEVAFRIPRLSSYCGRYIRHGGWWPDYVSRLFRRGAARFAGGIVHDHLVAEGAVGKLRNALMHESFTDMHEVLQKMNSYSSWGAQTLHETAGVRNFAVGRRVGILQGRVRRGFLDGREGFLLSVSNAEGAYYKYVKLMLRDRQPGP
jgi:hypothetical protein